MTNVQQRLEPHKFDQVSEPMSTMTHDRNGNGKTSVTAVPPDVSDTDDLTLEEEQQLAGFNPATPQLISEAYRLQQDQERAVERPLAERASIRLGSVVAVVGTAMGAGAVVWFGFLQPRTPARPVTPSLAPTPAAPPTFDETAELKSRLAFQDQKQQLQPEPVTRPRVTKPPRPPTLKSIPPARTPVAVASPAPVFRPEPVVVRAPIAPPERIQPVERIDPFQHWAQLAKVGQERVNPRTPERSETAFSQLAGEPSEPSSTASSQVPEAQSNPVAAATQQNTVIPVVSIGATKPETAEAMPESSTSRLPNADVIPEETSAEAMSPGMVGILNRTPVGSLDQRASGLKEVAIATATKAKVTLPMLWDEGSQHSTAGQAPVDHRFAVELTEAMQATDGTVALPAGTVLVVRTSTVEQGNHLVSASVIAIVYRDRTGQIRQQALPPDSLQIRGQDNRPLIAQKLNDVGPEIARQDVLTGLLSSLGRVGSIVNQPRTQSSAVISGGSLNQSVSTTSAEPQLWAAAVEGFFNPIMERMSSRSEQTRQELLQRSNVVFIPEGTEVSVVVNSFLRVDR
ncbi:MAG: hypothetical protein KME42_20955 [Tildeniella nuda ZEHNDER 1965/U140]|jgi:hypothetical protein|nr:hypothetical protein [Tildeniella nuda ZEHNDER 1965/U140]